LLVGSILIVDVGLLLLARVFHFTIHRQAIAEDSPIGPVLSRLAE